jgi:3'-phosphoadenosine 5'-phosphosulfate (PAPS) 3'-phosphatase
LESIREIVNVVKGNADAYLHTTKIKKWDLCAANAILSSVDGKMTTLSGDWGDRLRIPHEHKIPKLKIKPY